MPYLSHKVTMNLLDFTLDAVKYFYKLALICFSQTKVLVCHLDKRNDTGCNLVNVAIVYHRWGKEIWIRHDLLE